MREKLTVTFSSKENEDNTEYILRARIGSLVVMRYSYTGDSSIEEAVREVLIQKFLFYATCN